jgi:membrane protease YdiL (CAAX protease family)
MENYNGFPPIQQKPRIPFYNKFLEAGREGKNEWWRYLIGIILTFFVGYSLVGAIPLLVLIARGLRLHYFSLPDVLSKQENLENPAYLHVDANVLMPCLLFIFVAGMFFLWVAVRFIHQKRFMSIIASEKKPFDFKRFFVGAGIWFALSVIVLIIGYFLNPGSFVLIFEPGPFIIALLICLIMLPIQTGWEELFLRGYVMQGLGLWLKKPIWPLLITSVVFGLLHLTNAEVKTNGVAMMLPQYILPGLIFGIITLLDERIEIAWGMHFANNFFGILSVTSAGMSVQSHAIWQVPALGSYFDLISGVVSFAVVVAILGRIYKWNPDKIYRTY